MPGFEQGGNHYEKSGVLLTRRGPGPGLPMSGLAMAGEPGSSVYHMGTISRAAIGKQNSQRDTEKNQQVSAWETVVLLNVLIVSSLQVVDSAYGTTRSVKKVYL